ncbi:hypothetical protein HJC23_006562 [Cyclotella cryptica]|uniref:Orc1-like AAA ATPase domain-containing protein n=1 Tax=Cyclotella cryptica TaxID=29204 RepID=A0ABD3PLL3_9STRA
MRDITESFSTLVHVISSLGRPLLIIFDDLQWAVDLITYLMVDRIPDQFVEIAPITQVLFVGLYRSDEVNDNQILSTRYFPAFNSVTTMDVHSILLPELTRRACNSLITNALRLPSRLMRSLADIVHGKTSGNVFCINVRWVWRLDTVKVAPITEDIAQLMTRNLQILPETTMYALQLLSCLGSNADESICMLLKDHIDIFNELEISIERNIIEKEGQVYKFTHDILEQSVYDMMSTQEQNNKHLFIGLELLKDSNKMLGSQFRPVMLIAIDQINRAKVLRNTQLSSSCSAEISMSMSDFLPALSYAEHGISFLDDHLWDHYKLALRLYEMSCNACFKSYQIDEMQRFLDEIFDHAKYLLDKLLLIEALVLMGQDGSATDHAFSLLEELGDLSPEKIPPHLILNEVLAARKALSSYTDHDIKNAPRVSDWSLIARIRVLGSLMPFLFAEQPQYIPYIACRIINLSIQHGCGVTEIEFMMICDYIFFNTGFSSDSSFGLISQNPKAKVRFLYFLVFFRKPLQAVVDLHKNNYRSALMVGDAFSACVSIGHYTRLRTMCGHYLPDLEKECKTFSTHMTQLTYPSACLTYLGISDAIHKLSGSPMTPFSLMPGLKIRNKEDYIQQLEAEGISHTLQAGYFSALFVSFWHTKYVDAANWAKKYRCWNQNRFLDVYHSFYEGLSSFQLACNCSHDNISLEAGRCAITLFKKWNFFF